MTDAVRQLCDWRFVCLLALAALAIVVIDRERRRS